MVRRILMVLGISVLFAGLSACGSDSTGPKDTDWLGTYALETVEGQNLPAVLIQIGNDKLEITAGSIRLNEDQTFSASLTFRTTEGGNVTTDTESDTGTYTKNGNALRFTYGDGSQDTGSLNGKVLTVTSEGITLVLRK